MESDQNKALFNERLKALIMADNAAEDAYTGDISDCYKSTVQVQPNVESSSNFSASHYEIMTASRDKGSHMYGLGSVCSFPHRQSGARA